MHFVSFTDFSSWSTIYVLRFKKKKKSNLFFFLETIVIAFSLMTCDEVQSLRTKFDVDDHSILHWLKCVFF